MYQPEMMIKDCRWRSLPSFLFSVASLVSSPSLFIRVSLPPPALFLSVQLQSSQLWSPFLSPVCWNAIQLFNHSPETNQHLFGGQPRPSHCRPAANTPAAASLTPCFPDEMQARQASNSVSQQENCVFARRQYRWACFQIVFLRFCICDLQVVTCDWYCLRIWSQSLIAVSVLYTPGGTSS